MRLACKLKRAAAAAWLLMGCLPTTCGAQEVSFGDGNSTRGLMGGWGHSWRYGVPGFEKTTSDVQFVAFHPQMGWFVTDRLELYGEGTLLIYYRPTHDVSVGLAGLGGRYHLWNDRDWAPYVTAAAGFLWTSLTVPELDRVFNFQLLYGVGIRVVADRGPGWIVELRNHHISNAGTAGTNLGLNTLTATAGVQWILR
ncbi:MAG: acyloxyacyl hydrolase [Vicinamibacterales bacterium]